MVAAYLSPSQCCPQNGLMYACRLLPQRVCYSDREVMEVSRLLNSIAENHAELLRSTYAARNAGGRRAVGYRYEGINHDESLKSEIFQSTAVAVDAAQSVMLARGIWWLRHNDTVEIPNSGTVRYSVAESFQLLDLCHPPAVVLINDNQLAQRFTVIKRYFLSLPMSQAPRMSDNGTFSKSTLPKAAMFFRMSGDPGVNHLLAIVERVQWRCVCAVIRCHACFGGLSICPTPPCHPLRAGDRAATEKADTFANNAAASVSSEGDGAVMMSGAATMDSSGEVPQDGGIKNLLAALLEAEELLQCMENTVPVDDADMPAVPQGNVPAKLSLSENHTLTRLVAGPARGLRVYVQSIRTWLRCLDDAYSNTVMTNNANSANNANHRNSESMDISNLSNENIAAIQQIALDIAALSTTLAIGDKQKSPYLPALPMRYFSIAST